jgi:hypothetical protein
MSAIPEEVIRSKYSRLVKREFATYRIDGKLILGDRVEILSIFRLDDTGDLLVGQVLIPSNQDLNVSSSSIYKFDSDDPDILSHKAWIVAKGAISHIYDLNYFGSNARIIATSRTITRSERYLENHWKSLAGVA